MLDTVLFASELVYIWVFVKYPFRIHDNCSNKNPQKKKMEWIGFKIFEYPFTPLVLRLIGL